MQTSSQQLAAGFRVARRYAWPALLSLVLSLIGGCRTIAAPRRGGPTQADRLVQFYPDLRGGRFAVIADFEDPSHMELVQLFGTTDVARRALDGRRGRRETGSHCLLFTSGSPNDAIVINNETATHWYLKRDWRAYDLLLLSVNVSTPDTTMEIGVSGGAPTARLTAVTSEPLERGWNLLRLDLAEMGERVPLDDVQEIRLSIPEIQRSVEVAIDDLLLTSCRRNLVGDPKDAAGGFFVQQAGKRWRVGAGGRFELTFANGQIVEWFNPTADPYRLNNLVRGAALGPTPVAVSSEGVTSLAARFGRGVVAYSKMVEANAVRAVVLAEWRFVRKEQDARRSLDQAPFARSVYTVYPTGQVFVSVESTALPDDAGRPGLALALSDLAGDAFQIGRLSASAPTETAEGANAESLSYATAYHAAGDASLLFVASGSSHPVRFIRDTGGQGVDAATVSLVAVRPPCEAPVESWKCHLFVGAGRLAEGEAAARVQAVLHPPTPRVEVGMRNDVAGSGAESSGFDLSEGCYTLSPDRGRVLWFLDGGVQPLFSPVFRVLGEQDRVFWVYVDHLIFKGVIQDDRGRLLFQLPGPIRASRLVEVYSRRKGE